MSEQSIDAKCHYHVSGVIEEGCDLYLDEEVTGDCTPPCAPTIISDGPCKGVSLDPISCECY
jgi:hypothetical protein